MTGREFARGSAIQGTAWGVSLALQAGHFALAARFLAPSDFSAYVAALALYGITGALSEFGLQQTTVLELAHNDERVVVRASSEASVVLAVASLAIATAIAVFALPHAVREPALYLIPAFVIARAEVPFQALRQHRLQFGRLAAAEVTGRALAFGSLLCIVLFDSSLAATGRFAALGLTMAGGLVLTVVLLLARPKHEGSSRRLSALRLLAEAVPLGLTNAASFVHVRIDQVILAAYGVTLALADYAIAYRILDAAVALVSAVGMVALPLLARQPRSERAHAAREFQDLLVVVAVLLGVGAVALAPQLVLVLGGSRYPYASWLARLLSPALVVGVLNVSAAQVVIVERRAASLLRIALFGVALNVALNVLLIPSYGVRAAAFATVTTETVGAMLVAALAQRLVPGSVDWRGLAAAIGGFGIAAFGGLSAWREVGPVFGVLVGVVGVAVALVPLTPSLRQAAVSWRSSRAAEPVPDAP